MTQTYERPEWVVVGAKMAAGVMVLASKTLLQLELEQQMDYFDIDYSNPFAYQNAPHHSRVEATMKTFVMVFASTYAEAMSKLFGAWNPDEQEPLELPVIRQLPRGAEL